MANETAWADVLDALAEALNAVGCEGWLVGGCLRDALLAEPVSDVDVALTSEPLPVAERLAARLPLAIGRLGHGTVRLAPRNMPGAFLDLTPLQGGDIISDLSGRDFTVNAMALPLASRAQWLAVTSGQSDMIPDLLDPFGGRADLAARRLVAVGPQTFRADPGRIIRAARLASRFGLHIGAKTRHLARKAAPLLARLSPDRVRNELALLLALLAAAEGVALLNDVGALAALYPGLSGVAVTHALATLRQLDQLIGVVDATPVYPALRAWGVSDGRRIALRLAALNHANDAHTNDAHAGDHHSGAAETRWRRALAALETEDEDERLYAARLLFDQAGRDEGAAVDALLGAAACELARGSPDGEMLAARADALVAIYLRDRQKLIPPPLLIGKDLMVMLGVPSGPEIGRLLRAVRQAQLADTITDRDEALTYARRLSQA